MTFNDVIMKNFTRSLSKYLSYFLSGVFCVAMFFMYSTMLLLDSVSNELDEYPMLALFLVTSIIIGLFSIFFISYAHQAFVTNKKKELAVYMTVGMDERLTRRMLGAETSIIAAASIIVGMLAGCLFSRFFQMIVTKIAGIDNIEYKLSLWNFVVTFVVFAIIYAGCFFKSDRELSRADISTIMKEKRKKEGKQYRTIDSVLAVTGLVGLIFSGIFIYFAAPDNHINSKLWVVLIFIITGYGGLFMLVGFGGKTVVHFLKKRKNYYRKMLTISEIDYKYKQNVKVIMILAMLASMIVLLVGSPVALITISGDIAEEGSHDVEFISDKNTNEEEVENILNEKEIKDRETEEFGIVHDKLGNAMPVMSVENYNAKTNSELKVKDGELYYLVITWEPGTNGVAAGDTCSFNTETGSESFKVCEALKGKWMYGNLLGSKELLIITQNDYEKIYNNLNVVTAISVTYKDGWRNTDKIVKELKSTLGKGAYSNSIIERYKALKKGYSVFLFVTCSMCFMFFISTGYVLYFKQYNEIEDEKAQYRKLYNLGIGDKEIKRSISVKMAVVYFTPLLGSLMGIFIMYYLSNLFGGNEIVNTFMKKGTIGLVCYSVSQLLFYIFLRVRYVHDVTAE